MTREESSMENGRLQRDPVWDQALDWLLAVQERPQDVRLRTELETWLAADPRHRAAYDKAQRVWTLTGDVAPIPETQEAPGSGTVVPFKPRRPVRRRALAAGTLAACLAFLVLLGPVQQLLDGADLSSPTGELVASPQPDGSVIILNADSAIRTDFTGTRRQVVLVEGEAFFQVTRDKTRPFAVQAADTVVTVTGTAFGTRLGADDVMVEVEEGSVAVATPGRPEPVRLTPGARLSVDRTTGAVRVTAVPTSHIAAWRRHLLIAEGERLGDVLDRIRPHYSGAILTTDTALLDRPVSGVFDLRRPREALRAAATARAASVYEITPLLAVVVAD
ncbi:MAG: FecR domain-containing protein [Alphaproteobacteria bacterium]|nr:FecR domain-containing protein [Alphaproteobacteria bacterium]